MTLDAQYLTRTSGNREQAASALAFDLMQGDPASFKQGYTLENAAIASAEVFGLDRSDVEQRLRGLLDVRGETTWR